MAQGVKGTGPATPTERMRKWRQANPERARAQSARTRQRRREDGSERNSMLVKRYGITADDFELMLSEQGWRCAICRTLDPGGMGAFHVDHCHDTGKVRGLLCFQCNRGLGLFDDEARSLRRAADYLERSTVSGYVNRLGDGRV